MATERIEIRLNPQVAVESEILTLIEGPGNDVAYGAKSRFLKERLIAGLRDLLDEVDGIKALHHGDAEAALRDVQSNAYRYDAVHYTALMSLLGGGAAREPRESRPSKDVITVASPSVEAVLAEVAPPPVPSEIDAAGGPAESRGGVVEPASTAQPGEEAPVAEDVAASPQPQKPRWGHMSGIAGQRRG